MKNVIAHDEEVKNSVAKNSNPGISGTFRLGAIYYSGIHNADCEIFGLDLSDDCDKSTVTEALLIASLNAAKEDGANSMYFFNDAEIHTIAGRLGFRCVTVAHYFEESL